VDDGRFILDSEQAEQQFESSCALVFSKKRQRITKRDLDALRQPPAGVRMATPEKQRAVDPVAACSTPDAQEDGGLFDIEESASLARKLRSRTVVANTKSSPLVKSSAKAKAKASPGGLSLGKTGAGKLTGKAKEKQVGLLQTVLDEAASFRKSVLRCSSIDELKLLEIESKEIVSKTTNKEDAMIDLDMEDGLADYRSLAEFAVTARGLLRSWKAFVHTASEKNRGVLSCAWEAFRQPLNSLPPDLCYPHALAAAVCGDIAKGNFLIRLNQEDWTGAVKSVAIESLVDLGMPASATGQVQVAYVREALKKIIRKYHSQPDILAEQWLSTMEAAGDIGDEEVAVSLRKLTHVIAYDHEDRTPNEINEGLAYVDEARKTDPFVKTIAVLGSQIISNAVRFKDGTAASASEDSHLQNMLGDLQRKAGEVAEITTPLREWALEMRALSNRLVSCCSTMEAKNIEAASFPGWRSMSSALMSALPRYFEDRFLLVRDVLKEFKASDDHMTFTAIPADDAMAQVRGFHAESTLWIDTVALCITKPLATPLFKEFSATRLESLLPGETSVMQLYSMVAEAVLSLTEAAKTSEKIAIAGAANLSHCAEVAALATVVSKAKAATEKVPDRAKADITVFLDVCSLFVGAWAGRLVQQARSRFTEHLIPDMPQDNIFPDMPAESEEKEAFFNKIKPASPELGARFQEFICMSNALHGQPGMQRDRILLECRRPTFFDCCAACGRCAQFALLLSRNAQPSACCMPEPCFQ
jgi:hypothetical protein